MNKFNPEQRINFCGMSIQLKPFLTYSEKQLLIEKFKDKNGYEYKHGVGETGINAWYLHFNNKILSNNELIELFKHSYPNVKLLYYK